MREGIAQVREYRKQHGDAFYFNWKLKIDEAFSTLAPTHKTWRT